MTGRLKVKKREDEGQLSLPLELLPPLDEARKPVTRPILTLVRSCEPSQGSEPQDNDARALAKLVGYSQSLSW